MFKVRIVCIMVWGDGENYFFLEIFFKSIDVLWGRLVYVKWNIWFVVFSGDFIYCVMIYIKVVNYFFFLILGGIFWYV